MAFGSQPTTTITPALIQGSLTGGNGSYTSTNINTGAYTFTDSFAIDVTAPSILSGTITPLFGPSSQYGIISPWAPSTMNTLYVSETLFSVGDKNVLTQVGDSISTETALPSTGTVTVGIGKYLLEVSAFESQNSLGGYNLTVSSIAAPVPEPTEVTLMLSGMGLLGFIASRRKKSA